MKRSQSLAIISDARSVDVHQQKQASAGDSGDDAEEHYHRMRTVLVDILERCAQKSVL